MRRSVVRVAALVAGLGLVSACTSGEPTTPGDSPGSVVKAAETVPCADDITRALVGDAECALITVPVRHEAPGETLQVHVTRLQPPATPTGDPIVVVGTELAALPGYAGVAPLAQRTGREVILVDTRGTGHSVPSLSCPDLRASDIPDPAVADGFTDSVQGCFDRLTADGVDLEAFVLDQMAGDLEAIRVALGIESWAMITYGTASRIAFEALAQTSEHVSSVILDSPEMPGTDPREVALDLDRPIRDLLAACEADDRCGARYDQTTRLWDRAVAAVADEPMVLSVPSGATAEDLVPVTLDPALLVRVVRNALSVGRSMGDVPPGAIPRFLDDVVEGRTAAVADQVARSAQMPGAFCVGYLPKCMPSNGVSLPVYYSVLCHDLVRADAVLARPDADAAIAAAYGQSPYADLCASWPVSRANEPPAPLSSSVPTLAVVGDFAPYTSLEAVESGLAGFSSATVVPVADSHNLVPSSECLLTFRNEWLADPTVPVPTCIDAYSLTWEIR